VVVRPRVLDSVVVVPPRVVPGHGGGVQGRGNPKDACWEFP
jgi:hypothetical protein